MPRRRRTPTPIPTPNVVAGAAGAAAQTWGCPPGCRRGCTAAHPRSTCTTARRWGSPRRSCSACTACSRGAAARARAWPAPSACRLLVGCDTLDRAHRRLYRWLHGQRRLPGGAWWHGGGVPIEGVGPLPRRSCGGDDRLRSLDALRDPTHDETGPRPWPRPRAPAAAGGGAGRGAPARAGEDPAAVAAREAPAAWGRYLMVSAGVDRRELRSAFFQPETVYALLHQPGLEPPLDDPVRAALEGWRSRHPVAGTRVAHEHSLCVLLDLVDPCPRGGRRPAAPWPPRAPGSTRCTTTHTRVGG